MQVQISVTVESEPVVIVVGEGKSAEQINLPNEKGETSVVITTDKAIVLRSK
jgi:hypothetical protein